MMLRYHRERVLLRQPRLSAVDAALFADWQAAERQYAAAQSQFEAAVAFEDVDEAILALQTAEARRAFIQAQLHQASGQ